VGFLAHLTPGEVFALAAAFLAGVAVGAASLLNVLRGKKNF
jgi:hypothetical protein